MNPDTGYIHIGTTQDDADKIAELMRERESLAKAPLVEVPDDQIETVVNMNRQQRRAWARREAKRLSVPR